MVKGRGNSEVVSAGPDRMVGVPLLSIGPSGIGGEGQWEMGKVVGMM